MVAYMPTTWIDNAPPAIDAANLNKLEQAVATISAVSVTKPALRTQLNSKILMGNIVPSPAMTGANPWGQLFVGWGNGYWDNWIKPQVDRAVALGRNAVRLIGAPECTLVAQSNGMITQAQYNAQWAQLAEYCAINGLVLYPCLVTITDANDIGGGPTGASLVASVQSSSVVLAGYANVLGADVFQEGGSGLTAANVLSVMASIRAVAPGLALTMSHNTADGWFDTSSIAYQVATAAGGSDFIDYHSYADGNLAANVDFIAGITNKPILIGEFGDSQDQSHANQTARYSAMASIHNRPHVIGSGLWGLADQSATNTSQYGVGDNTGFVESTPSAAPTGALQPTSGLRSWLVSALALFNRANAVSGAYQAPNVLAATQARPTTNTGQIGVGGNTSLTFTPDGVQITAIGSGGTLAAVNPLVGINVIQPNTWYSVKLTGYPGGVYNGGSGRVITLNINWYDASGNYVSTSSEQVNLTAFGPASPIRLWLRCKSPSSGAALLGPLIQQTAGTAGEYLEATDMEVRAWSVGLVDAA